MPDFEARIESGSASVALATWTDLTPNPVGDVQNRRNPIPGIPEVFLLATGSIGDTISIRAVPMGNIGRHEGSGSASILQDSNQSWTPGALVGSIIENLSDGPSGSYGTIIANTATTITATLSGGSFNYWYNGNRYRVRMADAALEGRLFLIDVLEHPLTPPSFSQTSGWSAEATIGLLADGHYTLSIHRTGGGGLILHLDAEVS